MAVGEIAVVKARLFAAKRGLNLMFRGFNLMMAGRNDVGFSAISGAFHGLPGFRARKCFEQRPAGSRQALAALGDVG